MRTILSPLPYFYFDTRAGSDDIDIKVSRHRTVSVSNAQSIKVSTDGRMVHFQCYSWIPGLIHPLNFLRSNFNCYFPTIISSFSLYKLDEQRKYRVSSIEYRVSSVDCRVSSVECRVSSVECRVSSVECRVSSIEHNFGIVRYRMNDGIDPTAGPTVSEACDVSGGGGGGGVVPSQVVPASTTRCRRSRRRRSTSGRRASAARSCCASTAAS